MNKRHLEILKELNQEEKNRLLEIDGLSEAKNINNIFQLNDTTKDNFLQDDRAIKYSLDTLLLLSQLKPEISYSWDDKGFGELYAHFYKDKLRYNTTLKSWMFFNGKIWVEDTGNMHAARCGKELALHLHRYSYTIKDGEKSKEYAKSTFKLGKLKYRDSMIKDARDFYFMSNEDLDKDIFTFNCTNGTLDLKTFEFKDHNPNDLLSKISNVFYNPDATSPSFEKFMSEVMLDDNLKIEYLQKILGHSLTGDVKLETCFILYGSTTRNGKSTLVETFAYMLGNTKGYSSNMKPETLALKKSDSRQASGDIARLDGCRFLNASEPPKRMIFDVGLLKTLLGRDTITARHVYQSEFEFIPVFKLFINTNFLPLIGDDSLFSSGRINVISFDRHFKPKEQDKFLKDKLRTPENISGLFNWCVDGLKKFYKEGADPPRPVEDATADYRTSSDKMGNFLSECLVFSQNNTKAKDVYNTYQMWCSDNGYGVENKTNFFSELKAKGLLAATGTVDDKTCKNVIIGMELGDHEIQDLFNEF